MELTKETMQEALNEFKDNLPTYLTQEDLDNKVKDFETKLEGLDMTDELAELKEAVEKQGLEMKKYNESKKTTKTIAEHLHDVREELLNAAQKTVTIKTDVTRASITNSTISMRLPDVGQLATQANRLAPLFAQGSIGAGQGGVVRYIDQTAVTNAAAAVAEARGGRRCRCHRRCSRSA